MKIFLAGIMQGSHLGALLHNQQYRARLRRKLQERLPQAEIYDPLADHTDSLDYDEPTARRVFFDHLRMCGETDVLIAFVPEASMGTAVEMWEASRGGRVVLTISPLAHNWAVRFLSHMVYADLDQFEVALDAGDVADSIQTLIRQRNGSEPHVS